MGRKRNIFVREFFTVRENENSVCKICKKEFSGMNVTNLKRHMVTNHLDIYTEERESFEETDAPSQPKLRKFSVEYCAEVVKNACVELVTKAALPFAFFDYPATNALLQPIFTGLNLSTLSSHNIMDLVSKKCLDIKNKIRRVVKQKMICLKMDIATRHDRSILGINIQLISHGQIYIYSLSMKELTGRHTAHNLKEEVETVLEEYNINKKQIYSITTDNGRNMIKAVDLLAESHEENEDDSVIESLSNTICTEHNIVSTKCAAHTLQLAVKDFFEINKIDLINRARHVAKTLRAPSHK